MEIKYEVIFEDRFYQRSVIGHASDKAEAVKMIYNFLEQQNYHAPYLRSWETADNETCYDVGSHSEFFYIKKFYEED